MTLCVKYITLLFKDAELLNLSLVSPQPSDAAPSSDGSFDAAKMAELESRLAAQTTETERLKVCRMTVQQKAVNFCDLWGITLHVPLNALSL